jgi:hypothetical protein
MKKNKVHIIWAIIAVVALGGGFFWGKAIGSANGNAAGFTGNRGSAGGTGAGLRGTFTGPRGAAGGGFATGQVTAIDAQSITLQLANGNSENVFYSSSTQVIVPQPASISDIKTGSMIIVGGSTDSSGNITATTIQVRGAGGAGPGAGTSGFGG